MSPVGCIKSLLYKYFTQLSKCVLFNEIKTVRNVTCLNNVLQEPPRSTWNAATLRHYIIRFKQAGQENQQEEKVLYPTHSLRLDNLVKDVNYEVTVTATNAVGDGPPSTPAIVYVGEAGM